MDTPTHDVFLLHGKRPVMQADPSGPKTSQPLEMHRRVLRIAPQQLVAFVGQAAYFLGKLPITSPKPRSGLVLHRSVQRPARNSSSASSARASRRPAATSSSI